MSYAVITSSAEGYGLALRIKENIASSVDIYAHDSHLPADTPDIKPYSKLSKLVEEIFHRYNGLIFIMASGIVVRSIAPMLASKLSDPAVLVADSAGKNIISLISGHMGGANDLTEYLAEKLGANPVITTATDVKGIVAPDVIASRLNLKPYPKKNILVLNSALLDGKSIEYWIDEDVSCVELYLAKLKENGVDATVANASQLKKMALQMEGYRVIISEEQIPAGNNSLLLRPKLLIAGLGCRRGVPMERIYSALSEACNSIGWTTERVNLLASTVFKQDEQGLLDMAKAMNKEIKFWHNERLREQIEYYDLEESDFVRKHIGVGNVAESSALCCVSHGIIASPKTKYEKVTVALIWER